MEYKNINSIILLESPWYYVPLYLWKLTINEKWPFWNTCIKIPLYPSCWRSENLVSHLSDSFIFSVYYRACGATIVNRTDEIREEDVGTECGLFYIEKFGDE